MHQPQLRLRRGYCSSCRSRYIENITSAAVLGLPRRRLRCRAAGTRTGCVASAASPALTPLAVGFQQLAIVAAALAENSPGDVAKAIHAHLAIVIEHGRADDFRQFAGRVAAQQIHLKEPVLRMHEAGGKRQIDAIAGADRGNSQCVALDDDRRSSGWRRKPGRPSGPDCRSIGCGPKSPRRRRLPRRPRPRRP